MEIAIRRREHASKCIIGIGSVGNVSPELAADWGPRLLRVVRGYDI